MEEKILKFVFAGFLFALFSFLLYSVSIVVKKDMIDLSYYEKEKKIEYLKDLNRVQESVDKVLTKMEADSLNKEVQKMIEEELK